MRLDEVVKRHAVLLCGSLIGSENGFARMMQSEDIIYEISCHSSR